MVHWRACSTCFSVTCTKLLSSQHLLSFCPHISMCQINIVSDLCFSSIGIWLTIPSKYGATIIFAVSCLVAWLTASAQYRTSVKERTFLHYKDLYGSIRKSIMFVCTWTTIPKNYSSVLQFCFLPWFAHRPPHHFPPQLNLFMYKFLTNILQTISFTWQHLFITTR